VLFTKNQTFWPP